MAITATAAVGLLLTHRQDIQDGFAQTYNVLNTAHRNDVENDQAMAMAKAELARSLWIHLKALESGYDEMLLAVQKQLLESVSSMYKTKLSQYSMARYFCGCRDLDQKVTELRRETKDVEQTMTNNGGFSRSRPPRSAAAPGLACDQDWNQAISHQTQREVPPPRASYMDCILPGLVDDGSDSEVSTVDSLPDATFSVTFRGTCNHGHEMTVQRGLRHNDTVDLARVRGHCPGCSRQAPLRNVSHLDWDASVVNWKFYYCSDACDHYSQVTSNQVASPFRFATVLPDKLVPPTRQGPQHSHRQPRKPVFEYGKLTFTATPLN